MLSESSTRKMPSSTGRRKLTITAHTMGRVADFFIPSFEELGWEVAVRVPQTQYFSALELAEISSGSEVVIIGDDHASEIFFRNGSPHLKLLVKWGIGTDSIDFHAADRFGVRVRNTPGVFSDEVADLAMAYVLALARQVVAVHIDALEGRWSQVSGATLAGKTLGIVGFGSIGRAIASRSLAFGMKVAFFDPLFADVIPKGCMEQSLNEVLKVSDFLMLACPSTPDTRGMVNSESLGLMKDGSFLINVARGDLVVEEDLVAALHSGRLSGVALDVYETEPLPEDSELRQFSNVVLGAHNGSNTTEGLMRASSVVADIVIGYSEETRDG